MDHALSFPERGVYVAAIRRRDDGMSIDFTDNLASALRLDDAGVERESKEVAAFIERRASVNECLRERFEVVPCP